MPASRTIRRLRSQCTSNSRDRVDTLRGLSELGVLKLLLAIINHASVASLFRRIPARCPRWRHVLSLFHLLRSVHQSVKSLHHLAASCCDSYHITRCLHRVNAAFVALVTISAMLSNESRYEWQPLPLTAGVVLAKARCSASKPLGYAVWVIECML